MGIGTVEQSDLERFFQSPGSTQLGRTSGLRDYSNPNGTIMPSAYTLGSDNAASQGSGFGYPYFSTQFAPHRSRGPAAPQAPRFFDLNNMNQDDDYGGVFGKIGEYGGKALDWAGKQGASELFKMGMGIKDQFFDRPKMIQSYLDQGSSMNALRGKQMAAIDENIAGMQRNEARKTAEQLRNYNAQRPQGTPEKTQYTPTTYV